MLKKNRLIDSSSSLTIKKIQDERLINKQELAEFLGVSIKMIDKKVSHGEIPYFKVGSLVRFSLQRVIESLEKDLLTR